MSTSHQTPGRILIAPDKFKGSLTGRAAAEALCRGFKRAWLDVVCDCVPMADGGEGLLEVFHSALGGEWRTVMVRDALRRQVEAKWLLVHISGEPVAVVETSQACGLWRIGEADRDPLRSTTHGVADLFLDATKCGVRRIIAGIGGSATNDAGMGVAEGLGYRFLDDAGQPVSAMPLQSFARILPPDGWDLPPMTVAGDVANPLLGERGATRVYGLQKGLRSGDISPMERAHAHLADLVRRDLGKDFSAVPGAGAAGGLGFALMTFCDASFRPGFDLIAESIGLAEKIAHADLVVTGEGSLDAQTLEGKTALGVARLAALQGRPVVAIAGRLEDENALHAHFQALASIVPGPLSMEDACARAGELVENAAFRMAKTMDIHIGRQSR